MSDKTSKEKFEVARDEAVENKCRVNDFGVYRRVGAFDPWFRLGANWAYAYALKEMAQDPAYMGATMAALYDKIEAKDALLEEMGKSLEFIGHECKSSLFCPSRESMISKARDALAKFKAHKGDGE